MGNPRHYSLDLPRRCLLLIDELWPHVSQVFVPKEEQLGPLATTFLLSLATPMVVLPIERILKNFEREEDSYVDDRFLNSNLSNEFKSLFDRGKLSSAPFFDERNWSFSELEREEEPINLSRNFPFELARDLSSDLAFERASRMDFKQWIACIRNSLAHGGIAYLDESGQPSYQSASMYAFVSGKYADRGRGALTGIRVLRISEVNFRAFLRKWVEWLESIGISQALAA